MSEKRDNSGTLGKNTRKTKDTHPGYSGQCMIEGREFWISGWVKDGRDGSKFFSLAFKAKEQKQASYEHPAPEPTEQSQSATKSPIDDDDVKY